MQHQLGGFCLLLSLLGLLVLVDHVHDRIGTHHWRTIHLHTTLQHTLHNTYQALHLAAAELAHDKSFIKNVTWQLSHSTQQSIAAATAGAEHWQVTVFNQKCALMHGAPNTNAQEQCRNLRRGQGQAFTNHKPLQIGYLHAFTAAAGAVLITLPLQEKWLTQQPQLATLRVNLPPTDLAISNNKVQFVYQQAYLNHLFEHAPRYQELLFWLRLVLYFAAAIACVAIYWLTRRHTQAMQCDLQHLAAWSEQPTQGELLPVKIEHTMVRRILHNFGTALQAQLHYLNSVKKQIGVKNKLLARLNKENQRVRNMLAQQALTDAVIDQAAHFNVSFITNNIAIRDNAHDLRAAIFTIHRHQLKPMLQLSHKWQQEFSQRHVADFLGAYYNAEQENFLLRLEKDIRQLATLAEQTHAALSGTLHCTKQLSNSSRNLLTPLRFWERLLNTHTPQLEVNFAPLLRKAQELITKINSNQQPHFINRSTTNHSLLAAPEMLTAAFYHLYQFFCSDTQTRLTITSHTTLKNKRLFITISATGNETNKHNSVKKYHLDQARLILQKYDIEVTLSWLNNSLFASTHV